MSITIPKRFKEKIMEGVGLSIDGTRDSGGGIGTYLETSPYYFREYTIHGEGHVNAVLNIADRLIPQEDFEKLTNLDVSVLVMGILLHDLGMFIKETGLQRLIGLNTEMVRDHDGQELTWKELWEKFLGKLKRCSGKELDEIFGKDPHVFDASSYSVCAAFIRSYHHLIAYHIAVHGFPGQKTNMVVQGFGANERKLMGLLAKSHGMPMRDLEEEVEDFGYDNHMPLHVPIYYFMAILRLADLLDADGSRAPKILADMNHFASERSEREWTLNGLITDKQWPTELRSPHTLKVIAEPTNSKQFLELKSWFAYWQKELDLSWAVMGETHADAYKLTVRRITSNIFSKKYNFVTRPMELKVNPDIVKLLVAPLYGDDPSYGVRELLQNAVDACNERTALDGTPGEISVDVDTQKGTFTIRDNGIGMNEDVIANYYLTAGASYRYDSKWAESFVGEDQQPKIARSGRFGVGVLATFLIGNKAKVRTRHIHDQAGYSFEYEMKPELLNVEKIRKPDYGTTIEIQMNEKTVKMFKEGISERADWYCLAEPKIVYRVDREEKHPQWIYSLQKGEDQDGWFACDSKDYESLHWAAIRNRWEDFCLCNGFIIPGFEYSLEDSLGRYGYYGSAYFAVRDKKGIFPVDLARKKVLKPVMEENVIEEMCKFRLAQFLVNGYHSSSLFHSKGFLPKERSFVLNASCPVFLIGASEHFPDERLWEYRENVAFGFGIYRTEIAGDEQITSSDAYEVYTKDPYERKRLPACGMKIVREITWESEIEILKSHFGAHLKTFIKYIPTPIREGENNIMYKVIRELLPYEINGGWIPFAEAERERMYSDTYKKLDRYIRYWKERRH